MHESFDECYLEQWKDAHFELDALLYPDDLSSQDKHMLNALPLSKPSRNMTSSSLGKPVLRSPCICNHTKQKSELLLHFRVENAQKSSTINTPQIARCPAKYHSAILYFIHDYHSLFLNLIIAHLLFLFYCTSSFAENIFSHDDMEILKANSNQHFYQAKLILSMNNNIFCILDLEIINRLIPLINSAENNTNRLYLYKYIEPELETNETTRRILIVITETPIESSGFSERSKLSLSAVPFNPRFLDASIKHSISLNFDAISFINQLNKFGIIGLPNKRSNLFPGRLKDKEIVFVRVDNNLYALFIVSQKLDRKSPIFSVLEYVIINLINPLIFTYRVYRSYAEYSHKIIIDGCKIDWFVSKDGEGSFSYPNKSKLSQHTMGLCYLNKSSDILHEHPIFATDIEDLLNKIHLNNLFNNCIIEEF